MGTAPVLAHTAAPLAEEYDTALLDLDGVVYVGEAAVSGAVEGLAAARAAGMRLAFVTNNAARPPRVVAEQLHRLGVPATPDDVVTSAQAAARLLAEKVPEGARVLVVGGAGLVEALRERGLQPVRSAAEQPAAVVQGYAPELTYAQLAEGALALRSGALFVASNLDRTVPSARGPLPGNGALVEVLRAATDVEPIAAGKPAPYLHEEAVQRTGAERALVVGDRLDTDVAGALRAGCDSLLVLTGMTDLPALLRAGPRCRPSYVAGDVSALTRAHPPARPAARGWTCEGWTADVVDGELRLTGAGSHDDAVRALCPAAWAEPEPPDVTSAVRRLAEL